MFATKKQYLTAVSYPNYGPFDNITGWTQITDKFFTNLSDLSDYLDANEPQGFDDVQIMAWVVHNGSLRPMQHDDWNPTCGYHMPDPYWASDEDNYPF